MAECHLEVHVSLHYMVSVTGVVHLCPLFGCDVWNSWIFEDSAVEELHDIEVGANDLLILTQAESFRDWDVCVLERMENSVFAIDLVGCLDIILALLLCLARNTYHTFDKSVPGGFFLITYFFPFLSVNWYVGFDCPYPNYRFISTRTPQPQLIQHTCLTSSGT
jgi:hypothetical protein